MKSSSLAKIIPFVQYVIRMQFLIFVVVSLVFLKSQMEKYQEIIIAQHNNKIYPATLFLLYTENVVLASPFGDIFFFVLNNHLLLLLRLLHYDFISKDVCCWGVFGSSTMSPSSVLRVIFLFFYFFVCVVSRVIQVSRLFLSIFFLVTHNQWYIACTHLHVQRQILTIFCVISNCVVRR